MDKTELLKNMIDGIIKGDDTAAKAAFSPYIQTKTREILGYGPSGTHQPISEALAIKLKEYIDFQEDSPVQFRGDNVIVDGRHVGVIQNDPTDFESGINFIEEGGRLSKEFNTVEELYNFLINRYSKKGNVK